MCIIPNDEMKRRVAAVKRSSDRIIWMKVYLIGPGDGQHHECVRPMDIL